MANGGYRGSLLKMHKPPGDKPRRSGASFEGQPAPAPKRQMGMWIGRMISAAVPEFANLERYVRETAEANAAWPVEADRMAEILARPRTETRGNYYIEPRQFTAEYLSGSLGSLIVERECSDSRGNLIKPNVVKRRLRSISGQYAQHIKKRGFDRNRQALDQSGLLVMSAGGESPSPDMDPATARLRMHGGIFEVSPKLRPFGEGNRFGFRLSGVAVDFLRQDRDNAVDFFLDKLGIRQLDTDLEEMVHDTSPADIEVFYNGIDASNPYEIQYPQSKEDGAGGVFPGNMTFLDPVMKVVDIPDGDRTNRDFLSGQ